MNDRRYNREKQPIHLSEIERYRKDLQIGQQVEIRTRRTDFEDGTRTVQKCVRLTKSTGGCLWPGIKKESDMQ